MSKINIILIALLICSISSAKDKNFELEFESGDDAHLLDKFAKYFDFADDDDFEYIYDLEDFKKISTQLDITDDFEEINLTEEDDEEYIKFPSDDEDYDTYYDDEDEEEEVASSKLTSAEEAKIDLMIEQYKELQRELRELERQYQEKSREIENSSYKKKYKTELDWELGSYAVNYKNEAEYVITSEFKKFSEKLCKNLF
jgi:hypothetical protein